jgi:hypothetical protein
MWTSTGRLNLVPDAAVDSTCNDGALLGYKGSRLRLDVGCMEMPGVDGG